MKTPTTTHLLPTPPPTTHPLGWGEGVYKIACTLNVERIRTIANSMRSLPDTTVAEMFVGGFERAARIKGTNTFVTVYPTLGYIMSERRQEESYKVNLIGYDVTWQEKRGDYKNFEAEFILVSINAIDVLSHQELIREIRDGFIPGKP